MTNEIEDYIAKVGMRPEDFPVMCCQDDDALVPASIFKDIFATNSTYYSRKIRKERPEMITGDDGTLLLSGFVRFLMESGIRKKAERLDIIERYLSSGSSIPGLDAFITPAEPLAQKEKKKAPVTPKERAVKRGRKSQKLVIMDRSVLSEGRFKGYSPEELVMELGEEDEYRTLDKVSEKDPELYRAMEETGLIELVRRYGDSDEIPGNMLRLLRKHSEAVPGVRRHRDSAREEPETAQQEEPAMRPKPRHSTPEDQIRGLMYQIMRRPTIPSDYEPLYKELIGKRLLEGQRERIGEIMTHLKAVYAKKIDGMLKDNIVYFFNIPFLAMLNGSTEEAAIEAIARGKLRYQEEMVGLVGKFAKQSGIPNDDRAQEIVEKTISYAFKEGLSFYGKKSNEIRELIAKYGK